MGFAVEIVCCEHGSAVGAGVGVGSAGCLGSGDDDCRCY